jgi:hypothetical protein
MSQSVKDGCKLQDTQYCSILNRSCCQECFLLDAEDPEIEKTIRNIDTVIRLLPEEEGLARLRESSACCLCKGEHKGRREFYAIADYGHPEPKGKRSSALGIKVKTQVGSIVPLQIACCRRCKNNHTVAAYMQMVVTVLLVALGLIVMSIPPIASRINEISEMIPLAVFVALIPIGMILGKACRKRYIKKKSRETIFNLNEIEYVSRMCGKGWFPLSGREEGRLMFSKKPLKNSWFS